MSFVVERDVTTVDIGVIPEGPVSSDDLDRFSEDGLHLFLGHAHLESPPILLVLPTEVLGVGGHTAFYADLEICFKLPDTVLELINPLLKPLNLVLLGKGGLDQGPDEKQEGGRPRDHQREKGSLHDMVPFKKRFASWRGRPELLSVPKAASEGESPDAVKCQDESAINAAPQ